MSTPEASTPKSGKRKWDQPGPPGSEDAPLEPASKVARTEASPTSEGAPASASREASKDTPTPGGVAAGSKSASEAAAAAAAIAAKIAAQFASGLGGMGVGEGGDFTYDIDINDQRNRYLLTKSTTQEQIHEETGAYASTKGVWYPDRSKATERDPPLYIHLSAKTKEALDKGVAKVNELINLDLGSLVEKGEKGKRKWPEERLPVGLESIRNFNVRAKVVGPSGSFVKYIQAETNTRVQIKGLGSGFIDQETGSEEPTPLYIHITGPDESQVARAKVLTEDLLLVVRQEHAKVMLQVQQQQMELHAAQMAGYSTGYSGYSAGGAAPPPPSAPAPPPPPGGDPSAAQAQGPPAPTDTEAYAAYWAAYGYDVNSAEFKEWQASQQQQYAQYYAQYAGAAAAPAPPPDGHAPPPPPPS